MPCLQQSFALIIGALRRVAQAFGRVAIHAGFARHDGHAARVRTGKQRLYAVWMNGTKTGQAGRAMRERQIQIRLRAVLCISRIAKSHFFGKCILVEPINQAVSPAGNDCGLRIMNMRVDKARYDQLIAIIDDSTVVQQVWKLI